MHICDIQIAINIFSVYSTLFLLLPSRYASETNDPLVHSKSTHSNTKQLSALRELENKSAVIVSVFFLPQDLLEDSVTESLIKLTLV